MIRSGSDATKLNRAEHPDPPHARARGGWRGQVYAARGICPHLSALMTRRRTLRSTRARLALRPCSRPHDTLRGAGGEPPTAGWVDLVDIKPARSMADRLGRMFGRGKR